MAKKKMRVKLAAKLLFMYLAVGLVVSLTIGTVAYGAASKSMVRVYTPIWTQFQLM